MEEGQRRGHNTAIVVALITVLGGVATAIVANWDKIFGSGPAAPAPTTAVVAKEDVAPAGNAVAQELAAAASSAPNIAGAWTDAGGMQEQFVQQGSEFTYQQFAGGMLVGEGAGQVLPSGSMVYRFRFANGQVAINGRCVATVRGSDLIEGTCYPVGAAAFGIEMRRP